MATKEREAGVVDAVAEGDDGLNGDEEERPEEESGEEPVTPPPASTSFFFGQMFRSVRIVGVLSPWPVGGRERFVSSVPPPPPPPPRPAYTLTLILILNPKP